jgi:hypothetical protein
MQAKVKIEMKDALAAKNVGLIYLYGQPSAKLLHSLLPVHSAPFCFIPAVPTASVSFVFRRSFS